MNKSVHIAKSRQRYYKTLNNILLHVPNHALKDVYMLNYGIIKNTDSSHYTLYFVIKFFLYNFIKTDSLGFLQIPHYFWTITWIKEVNNFQKAKVQPNRVRFCFFFQPGVGYKQACSSIEVLMGFINSRSSHRRCSIIIGVLKKIEKFWRLSFLIKLQNSSERLLL